MNSNLHLCIPVLNRYDKLRDLLASLRASTVKPDVIHVIDNGHAPRRLEWACREAPATLDLFVPDHRMGVAESWNWFLVNVPEERIITNDDVLFDPSSIERMINCREHAPTCPSTDVPQLIGPCTCERPGMVTALRGRAFSCFLMRDSCVEQVGLFDDCISPGYAFFEDCDYEQRMRDTGTMFVHCDDAAVAHSESSTLAAFSQTEKILHAERYIIAQQNYKKKWGRLPEGIVEQQLAVIGGAR